MMTTDRATLRLLLGHMCPGVSYNMSYITMSKHIRAPDIRVVTFLSLTGLRLRLLIKQVLLVLFPQTVVLLVFLMTHPGINSRSSLSPRQLNSNSNKVKLS